MMTLDYLCVSSATERRSMQVLTTARARAPIFPTGA